MRNLVASLIAAVALGLLALVGPSNVIDPGSTPKVEAGTRDCFVRDENTDAWSFCYWSSSNTRKHRVCMGDAGGYWKCGPCKPGGYTSTVYPVVRPVVIASLDFC